jgi:cbb3-type cytochrome oxidase cytochrome c subunit
MAPIASPRPATTWATVRSCWDRQRTGVDLSQEGGEHPDDWHIAHFVNPRYTRPLSIMPPFEFLGEARIGTLTRYVQSLGHEGRRQAHGAAALLERGSHQGL